MNATDPVAVEHAWQVWQRYERDGASNIDMTRGERQRLQREVNGARDLLERAGWLRMVETSGGDLIRVFVRPEGPDPIIVDPPGWTSRQPAAAGSSVTSARPTVPDVTKHVRPQQVLPQVGNIPHLQVSNLAHLPQVAQIPPAGIDRSPAWERSL